MAKASAATGGFSAAAQARLTQVGTTMQTAGKKMTTWMTVPLLGVGAMATKMAMDFDTAFGQIDALTNVTASEIEGLKESVMELSGTTAKSPQELAEALYFAASAGLDSAAAMDVVTMSAQASAAGMGSTEDVTRVLASALNVYGEANLSAADAADILTAAVQEGSAAPEEYANSLGRVIPIAAQMGIGFDEVAGSIAFLTNNGLDADEAVTALRGTLVALMAPAAQSREALEASGTSVEELRAAIAEDGLLGALELLREHGFAGNADALRDLIPDIRAMNGASLLLADTSGTLSPILDSVANSSGALGEAFATTADTDAFKMRQAMADVQAAMVTLGAILLPIAADIATAIADLATWFGDLPGPVQGFMIAIGGLVAVMGPLLVLGGSIVKNFGQIKVALGGTAGPLGAVALAAVAAYAGYQLLTNEQRKTEENTKKATVALDGQFDSLITTAVAAARAGTEIDAVAVANEALSRSIGEGNTQLAEAGAILNVNAGELLDVLALMDADGSDLITTIDYLGRSFGLTAEQASFFANNYSLLTGPMNQFSGELRSQAEEMGITADEFDAVSAAVRRFIDAANETDVNQVAEDFLNARAGASAYGEELVRAAEAQSEQNRTTGDAIAVYRAYATGVAGLTDAQLVEAGITQEVAAETAALGLVVEDAAGELGELEAAALTGADAMEILNGTFDIMKRNMATGTGGASAEQWAWIDNFGAALDEVAGIQSGFVASQDAIWEAALGFGEAIDENSRSLAQNSVEGLHNRGVIADWSSDILGGVQASLAQGSSIADVTEQFKHNRQAMIDAAVAAGFEEDEVNALVDALGLADGDWEAAIKISGDQIAMQKLEAMLLVKEDLTEADVIQINTDLETGGAWYALEQFKSRANAQNVTLDVWANTAPARDAINRLNNISIGVGIYGGRFAEGGVVQGEQLVTVAESGPELILPLNNPGRMASLLGLPVVQAALGRLTPVAMSYGGGGWAGGSNSNVTNVTATIIMPPGSNGEDVVRALKKWERRSGPVPISTR